VIVTTVGACVSELGGGRGGAAADADLVAWLLTHRVELLRLAALGQANTAAHRQLTGGA